VASGGTPGGVGGGSPGKGKEKGGCGGAIQEALVSEGGWGLERGGHCHALKHGCCHGKGGVAMRVAQRNGSEDSLTVLRLCVK